jgi:hypothetical protein
METTAHFGQEHKDAGLKAASPQSHHDFGQKIIAP